MKVFCTVIENEDGKFEHFRIIRRFTVDNISKEECPERRAEIEAIEKDGYMITSFEVPNGYPTMENIYTVIRSSEMSEVTAIAKAIEEILNESLKEDK